MPSDFVKYREYGGKKIKMSLVSKKVLGWKKQTGVIVGCAWIKETKNWVIEC